MLSAATATATAPVAKTETLDLPATKLQRLRLQLQFVRRFTDLNCAAYVKTSPYHVVFACAHTPDDWRIQEDSNGDCRLWVSGTAFVLDPRHADRVRAFLAHTKADA